VRLSKLLHYVLCEASLGALASRGTVLPNTTQKKMTVNPCVLTLEEAQIAHATTQSVPFAPQKKDFLSFSYTQPFSTTQFLELGTDEKIQHIWIRNGESLELILSEPTFVMMESLQDPSIPDAANDASQAAVQQAIATHDNFVDYNTFQSSNDDRWRRTKERMSVKGQILTCVAGFAIVIFMAVFWLQGVGNLSQEPGNG